MGGVPLFTRRSALRCGAWPLYLAVAALLLIFVRFFLFEPADLRSLLPAKLPHAPWSGSRPQVYRPGDFVDQARIRVVPEVDGEPPVDEPHGVGTLHDKRDDRFYNGGLKTLTSGEPTPFLFDPYPAYNTQPWRRQWMGQFRACEGPRGGDLSRHSDLDMISVYHGNQQDFPYPMFGSHEALGLDANVCTDRCSRLGVYGHEEEPGPGGECHTAPKIDWNQVNWTRLQETCFDRNANRYKSSRDRLFPVFPKPGLFSRSPVDEEAASAPSSSNPSSSGQQHHSRSAVLIRSWHTMKWTPNHLQYVRSMIIELSLHSGSEYELFLIVDIKDPQYNLDRPIDIQNLKDMFIPKEFHDMTIFFSESRLAEWYPDIDQHEAKFQHLQPIQIFSQLHPNFDYIWQFEMDGRNTGNSYHFLDRIINFAREQPRKYLWERNAYYYTPGAHGSWEDFRQMVDKSLVGREDLTVWGPTSDEGLGVKPVGPPPPVSFPKDDNYQWGVGEEAELITLLPIFDPRNTSWTFPNIIFNVPPNLPRRASPITMWRMSKRLLDIMHDEALKGRSVVSEMTAPTWSLLHGLKAVYVPHPLYLDGQWTAKEVAKIYNPGEPELINGGQNSIWNWDHKFDHLMYRISYMFTTQTAEDLWRRFMGYPPDPDQYTDGRNHKDANDRHWYDGGSLDEEKYGRLCFPPMFVHTVKNTERVKGGDMAVPV